jgi:hypothetical protein
MAKNTHTSLRGKNVDMSLLQKKNELTPAVGNARVNARGDTLGAGNKIIKTREEASKEYYGSSAIVPDQAPAAPAAAPAPTPAPAAPKAKAKKAKAPVVNDVKENELDFDDEWVEDEDGNFVKRG